MTTEIDAEGLAAAREAFIRKGGYSFQPEAMSAAIRAYLSASRSTSEAEPVAWRVVKDETNDNSVLWVCADYTQDPCGSAKCHNCGRRRHEHPVEIRRAAPRLDATVRSGEEG